MVTMAAEPRRFLTVDEVAEELNVSEEAVYSWLRAGRLVGYKFGGQRKASWRILRDDLERFIDSSRSSGE